MKGSLLLRPLPTPNNILRTETILATSFASHRKAASAISPTKANLEATSAEIKTPPMIRIQPLDIKMDETPDHVHFPVMRWGV